MDGGGEGAEETALADTLLAAGSNQYIVAGDNMEHQVGGATYDGGAGDEPVNNEPFREQDRFLPIANVARCMKKSIPKNGKIAKDAKECVQECVSEFISFITSEASERCHQEKRKTINGEDILFAMSTLGFDNYVEPLKVYLQRYRESMKGDKPMTDPGIGLEAELGADEFSSMTNSILAGDGTPQNVYITSYGGQINPQQLQF